MVNGVEARVSTPGRRGGGEHACLTGGVYHEAA